MHIMIIGSGVAGSVLADLLSQRGHRITVLERSRRPGGMCKSYYLDGFVYEYGPHILAMHNCSDQSVAYIQSKIDSIETEMVSASCVQGQITYYPPSIYSAERLGIADTVKAEIGELPETPDETNFETYLLSKVGPTLYSLFFENFTRKFWGTSPASLSAEWAKTRHLGESLTEKKMFFNKKWCAYPVKDWNVLFHNTLRDIQVVFDTDVTLVDAERGELRLQNGERLAFDFAISTMHIDDLFDNRHGRLQYAGYRIEPRVIEQGYHARLDDQNVSMTYYPTEDVSYCRVTDYGTFQKKSSFPYDRATVVTYEYPDHSKRLYPFSDEKNETLFKKYLNDASVLANVFSFGRMGLYKYLTTDTTVEMAFRAIDYIENWPTMTPEARLEAYLRIRGDWTN